MIPAFLAFATNWQDMPERKPSLTGDIRIHKNVPSPILGDSRTIRVWLPPHYDAGKPGGYPVAYMLDGQNVFDGATSFIPNQEWRADETAQAMVESGLIPPIVIVALDNGGLKRGDEYLPTRAKLNGSEVGGEANTYADYLVSEVKPFIAKQYNVSRDPGHTALVGSSFGGVAAFHMSSTRPAEFGLVGAMSPSFWWDDKVLVKNVEAWESVPHLRIWMDVGDEEGPLMIFPTREMRDALVAKGFKTGRDLVYYEEPRAAHNEIAWARRFGLCLQFLFGTSARLV